MSPAFVRFGPRLIPRFDRGLYRLTGGRLLLSRVLLPVLVLTTTGPSGRPRITPLATLPEPDGSFLVVGSNWGRRAHPAWSNSLLGQPEATVAFDGRERPVVARLLEGPERDAVWPRLLALWPAYDAYARSSGRELRVFRLDPRPGRSVDRQA